MHSPRSLRKWIPRILPHASPIAHHAAAGLMRALLVGFTTNLTQLARQLDRSGPTKGSGQWLRRWLDRAQLGPDEVYPSLAGGSAAAVWDQSEVLLLIDATTLSDRFTVLQTSIPWQRRALPVWRVVYPYAGSTGAQAAALEATLEGLGKHLPGKRSQYVLVMDRGFPSNRLVTRLQQDGWRFVLRVKSNWRMEHAEYNGLMRDAVPLGLVGPKARLFCEARLGYREKGRERRSQANVVAFYGEGHAEPWFLVTSETDPDVAVSMYRQRMQIEQEFRDLKGPFGLDLLANWADIDRVACFLAWVAVYEWRLAYLWIEHNLASFREQLRVYGPLSWIRTVREWIARQIRLNAKLAGVRL